MSSLLKDPGFSLRSYSGEVAYRSAIVGSGSRQLTFRDDIGNEIQ